MLQLVRMPTLNVLNSTSDNTSFYLYKNVMIITQLLQNTIGMNQHVLGWVEEQPCKSKGPYTQCV